MADNYISAEQQMSENGRSSDSPVKYYKKKSRGKVGTCSVLSGVR